jgi:hypothetical protein
MDVSEYRLDRGIIDDVCENLQEYISSYDKEASMLSMAYIRALDEDKIRHIMTALLSLQEMTVPAGQVLEDELVFREIMAVWKAVCKDSVIVRAWLSEEIMRRRGARGAHGPKAPWLRGPDGKGGLRDRENETPRLPDGPEKSKDMHSRCDAGMLSHMRSLLELRHEA